MPLGRVHVLTSAQRFAAPARVRDPIGATDEIPAECGVMVYIKERLDVIRVAPKRPMAHLPFHVWMSLAKATP